MHGAPLALPLVSQGFFGAPAAFCCVQPGLDDLRSVKITTRLNSEKEKGKAESGCAGSSQFKNASTVDSPQHDCWATRDHNRIDHLWTL